MGKLFGNQTYRDILLGFGLLCATLSLILYPDSGSAAAADGLTLCHQVIVPSLFPFFVLSSLVVELGMTRYLGKLLEGVMPPLFRVGGNCAAALALGFVGGYPVGATTAISLYKNGQCSKTEAERLLAFCNNAGPAFILGVVGAGIFSSSRAGLLLYCAHICASLTVGLIFRFYKPQEGATLSSHCPSFQTATFPLALTRSVTGAMQSTINICAFILFFTVTIRMLGESGVMEGISSLLSLVGVPQPWAERLFIGLLEMSSGVSSLQGATGGAAPLSMAAFMLGWAGLSVHCQVLAFLGDSGLSMKTYFVGKFLHGLLSAGYTALLVGWFPLESPTAAYLTEQVETLATLQFGQSLAISLACSWVLWIVFFLLMVRGVKKRGGNGVTHGV